MIEKVRRLTDAGQNPPRLTARAFRDEGEVKVAGQVVPNVSDSEHDVPISVSVI